MQKNNPLALDDRGTVYLKMNKIDAAIADYNAALAINPRIESSLYGRGLAEFKNGDRGASQRDIAAAKAIDPDVANEFAELGLPAPSF